METLNKDESLRGEILGLRRAVGLLALVSIGALTVSILAIIHIRKLNDVIRMRPGSTNLVADRILTGELLVVPFPQTRELRDYREPKLPSTAMTVDGGTRDAAVAIRPGHLVVHGAGSLPVEQLVLFPAAVELWTRRGGAELEVRPDTGGKGLLLRTSGSRHWTIVDTTVHASGR